MNPCTICGSPVPQTSRGETCSFKCRAKLREQRKTEEWRKPRDYEPEVVEAVRSMYLDEGMTVAEVQAALPKGYKAQRIIQRYIPERRKAIKRDQRGERNHMWLGDEAGYQAAHVRVTAERGPASAHRCINCNEPAVDWSYNHTDPNERTRPDGRCPFSPDPSHYSPRCRACHRRFDRANAQEVMPHVS